MIPTEHDEQAAFVQWFGYTYPGVLMYANINGVRTSPKQIRKVKAEGMVSGIPDLEIPAWNLFIEMKRVKGGTVSPEQKQVIQYLQNNGKVVFVCKGCDDAIAFVESYLRDNPELLKNHVPLV